MTDVSLAGRVVAVSGGARGIGEAIARAAALRGMRVAIGDIDADLAQATARSIGREARAFRLDVSDEDSFVRFLDETEAALGPLYALVNNAGIMPAGAFADETRESTGRQIDVNVYGVVNGCRIALPRLVAHGSGHLINISSAAGKGGYPGIATYSGTKFFVVGFSEALRHELKGSGIHLSVVMPGFVTTELTAGLGRARFYKMIGPEDVAAGVLAALARPRFEVYVPRALGPMGRLLALLPRAVQDAALHATRADRLALAPDAELRAAYEQRAAHSVQAVDASDEPAALIEHPT